MRKLARATGTGLKTENFSFASGREFMEGDFKPGKDTSPMDKENLLEWKTPFLRQLIGKSVPWGPF